MTTPRVVLVTRRTEYHELVDRHGTRGQAEFVLRSRGMPLAAVLDRHQRTAAGRRKVLAAVPADWRRAEVERAELDRFDFEPADVVVVLGQDGLVANVAKYLAGQPVIGINPLPGTNLGVLVLHPADAAGDLLADTVAGRAAYVARVMARVVTDDGQHLDALNEVYVGQPNHQSARYHLGADSANERQSSSGVIVGTGTGASGWCASLHRTSAADRPLPSPESRELAWFVREAWPSPTTGTALVTGRLTGDATLTLRSESEALVTFGDGVEADRIVLGWGQRVTIGISPHVLLTVA